jgi:hypothetical protein
MPLLPGKKNLGKNVSELMHSFKSKHKIGTSHPKNTAAARKQAAAIAYSKANESYDALINAYLTEALELNQQPIDPTR